jgi:hypothetical protein
VVPCILGFVLGWVLWDRWLSQAATIYVWGLFLLPFAAMASIFGGTVGPTSFWLGVVGLFVLSLLLTELGIRLRDAYQHYLRHRFPRRFGEHPGVRDTASR